MAWTDAGAIDDPANLGAISVWLPAAVPGTAASALRSAGGLAAVPPSRLDGVDWWFRCEFATELGTPKQRSFLNLGGLATIADAWLNGEHLLRSENMFVAHHIDVSASLRAQNQLVLCFRALDPLLAVRRPRPRWRAPMVEHQQLRWFRTSLLGRTPGWSPALPPVGPWRPVELEHLTGFEIEDAQVRPSIEDGAGIVRIRVRLRHLDGQALERGLVTISGEGEKFDVPLTPYASANGLTELEGVARLAQPALWWPHTHGAQALYDAELRLEFAGHGHTLPLRRLGFRQLHLDTTCGDFRLFVNGQPIFCRGACWTTLDAATLTASSAAYAQTLTLMREAGMNMVRICGPMFYEADDFYDRCDELGIMVWHDFMFANMDYPEDPVLIASIEVEARQALRRWQHRPSLTVLCGDSEGEQQAAMWGAPRSSWHRPLFRELLPKLAAEVCPGVPYWPSSASGGAFPHQPNQGTTSYYGVGAYLRGFDDARRSEVRFGSEALGFANVPHERSVPMTDGRIPRTHTPAWKAGVPRDLGAGWDFEDVRDHYLQRLFGVDPIALRSTDHERYLALSRVTSGEVMLNAFAEWRRARSVCRGALIWFLRDLLPGAGWGVLDVTGHPKAAFYYLQRIFQSRLLVFSDEGLNGLYAHAVNERSEPWQGLLKVELFKDGETRIGVGQSALTVPERSAIELPIASLLDGFHDTTYAYRFGPPTYDVAVASWLSEDGTCESEAFHFPEGLPSRAEPDLGVTATARQRPDGTFELRMKARRFAHAAFVDTPGFEPDENYVHLAPGRERQVVLRRTGDAAELRGTVLPLNARHATRIVIAR